MADMDINRVYELATQIVTEALPAMKRLGWRAWVDEAAIGDDPDMEVGLALEAFAQSHEPLSTDMEALLDRYMETVDLDSSAGQRIMAALAHTQHAVPLAA